MGPKAVPRVIPGQVSYPKGSSKHNLNTSLLSLAVIVVESSVPPDSVPVSDTPIGDNALLPKMLTILAILAKWQALTIDGKC